MSTEITTIPRVYLKDQALWKSGHHTAYATPNGNPNNKEDQRAPESLVFEFGVARGVPLQKFELFRDAGIATTDRPVIRRFGDDDD